MNCIKIILLDYSTVTITESHHSSRSNLNLYQQMFSRRIRSLQISNKSRKKECRVNMIHVRYPHLRNNQKSWKMMLLKRIKNILKQNNLLMVKLKKWSKCFNNLLMSKSKRINNILAIITIKDKLKKNNLVELSLRRLIVSIIRLRERQRRMIEKIKMKTPVVVLK